MSKNFGINSLVVLIAMIAVGSFLLLSRTGGKIESNSSLNRVFDEELDEPQPETRTTPLAPAPSSNPYIFDYVDANGEYRSGLDAFGTEDKTGVTQAIMNAHQTRTPDFLMIGADNAAREQFLISEGHTFAHPDRTWNVAICFHAVVNGKSRLSVIADVGVDGVWTDEIGKTYEGVIGDATVFEIWELSETGGAPLLLERSQMVFDGLATHAESPVILETNFPTTLHGDGVDDMGDIPYP